MSGSLWGYVLGGAVPCGDSLRLARGMRVELRRTFGHCFDGPWSGLLLSEARCATTCYGALSPPGIRLGWCGACGESFVDLWAIAARNLGAQINCY
ncbi:hypothetical protein [Paenibacillus fonticola]|uniref:hypothetical protein n=1 Tax=Paenibacillus fonticola TaxID=379896 RepID=UPI0012F9F872|nr:hypothetical protein [Paenibacillus fonticola]